MDTYEFLLTTYILLTRVAMAELSLWYFCDVVSPSSDSKTAVSGVTYLWQNNKQTKLLHAVLKAGIIFYHKTWPVDVKELATFGEEAVCTLLQHFQTPLINKGCNLTDMEQECATMKVYIFEHLRLLQYEILWQRMLNEHSDEYKMF